MCKKERKKTCRIIEMVGGGGTTATIALSGAFEMKKNKSLPAYNRRALYFTKLYADTQADKFEKERATPKTTIKIRQWKT